MSKVRPKQQQVTSSLIRERETIRQAWALTDIPFRDVPPEDPAVLDRYFVGRDAEMDRAKSVLYGGGNLLVRGVWGIGKTAFIRTTLFRLQRDGEILKTPILPVHIVQFQGETADEFQRTVLYYLARAMTPWSPKATEILGTQVGRKKKRSLAGKGAAKLGLKVFEVEIMALRIVKEIISLGPLSDQDMRQIVIRQLNTVRRGDTREDAFPLTEEALDLLVSKAAGYPMRMNRIADRVFHMAAARGMKTIGVEEFTRCFDQIQSDLSLEVPPDVKGLLHFALRRKGLVIRKDVDLEEVFATVGVSSFQDLLPQLDQLVENGLLVREDRPEGIRYVVSPEAEKAAEQGEAVAGPPG